MNNTAISLFKVIELFKILFGESISLRESPIHVTPLSSMTISQYIGDDNCIRGWIVSDAQFSAGAGGALTMLPFDVVKNAIKDNDLSRSLQENLNDVMILCSVLIQSKPDSQVHLQQTTHPSKMSELPKLETCFCSSFEIDFAHYGTGRFTVAVCQETSPK